MNNGKEIYNLHQLFHRARTTADQHYCLLSMGTKNKTQQLNQNMLELPKKDINVQTYVQSVITYTGQRHWSDLFTAKCVFNDYLRYKMIFDKRQPLILNKPLFSFGQEIMIPS